MTARVVSPVIPSSSPAAFRAGSAAARRVLPVPELPICPDRWSAVCGTAAIDCSGRITEATVIPALGWTAGTRLDIRVTGGLVLVTADPHAVFRMTRPGHVRLPATVRHWCGLSPGSRVLLVADPNAGLLVVHPPAAVHAMVAQFHAAVLGGDAA